MAQLVLANSSRGEDHANERLAELSKKFKDAKFSVEPHEERRHRILVEVDRELPEAEFRDMQRVAQTKLGQETPKSGHPKVMPNQGRVSQASDTKSTVPPGQSRGGGTGGIGANVGGGTAR